MRNHLIFLSVLFMFASPAAARVGIGVATGTVGQEIYVTLKLSKYLDLVGAYHNSMHNLEYEYDNSITFDINAKMKETKRMGLRYYPFGNGVVNFEFGYFTDALKISATVIADNNNQFKFNATSYDINDVGTITGDVDFADSTAPYPYLLIGFGQTSKRGIRFEANFGVVKFGTPKIRIENQGCQLSLCQELRNNLDIEENKLNKDIEKVEYWPVVRLGIALAF